MHADAAQVIPQSQHAVVHLVHLLGELVLLDPKVQNLLGEGVADTEYALAKEGHGQLEVPLGHRHHLLDIVG